MAPKDTPRASPVAANLFHVFSLSRRSYNLITTHTYLRAPRGDAARIISRVRRTVCLITLKVRRRRRSRVIRGDSYRWMNHVSITIRRARYAFGRLLAFANTRKHLHINCRCNKREFAGVDSYRETVRFYPRIFIWLRCSIPRRFKP